MRVRLFLGRGSQIRKARGKNKKLALIAAAFLTPAALLAFVLACWCLAADLSIAQGFAIASGIFSHWQVWLFMAIAIEAVAFALNRYGGSDSTDSPIEE